MVCTRIDPYRSRRRSKIGWGTLPAPPSWTKHTSRRVQKPERLPQGSGVCGKPSWIKCMTMTEFEVLACTYFD